MVRQGATRPVPGGACEGSGLDLQLPEIVLSRPVQRGRLEQYGVPERVDAECAVGIAGTAGRGACPGGGWRSRAHREARTGPAGPHGCRAVLAGGSRHYRLPPVRGRAGRAATRSDRLVGHPVPGALHPARVFPQEGILEGRPLKGEIGSRFQAIEFTAVISRFSSLLRTGSGIGAAPGLGGSYAAVYIGSAAHPSGPLVWA